MKAIILAAIVLASCGKSKVDPPAVNKVTLTAAVLKERPSGTDYYWRVVVNFSATCTASGSATIEWDEYSASAFIAHKSQYFAFGGANSGSHSMISYITNSNYSARNIKITSASINGYEVKF